MNKTLFLIGLVCLLSACGFSECRYGTPYIRTCAPKWGGHNGTKFKGMS